jgi:LuxR family maltose regulon positive regulatory protein
LILGVLAAWNLNDPVRIDRFIRDMESSLDRSRRFDLRCYQSAIFWKCLLLRDFEQALLLLAEIDTSMELEQTIAILLGFGSIARVHLMHGLGRDREAAGFLREAYRYGRRNKGVNILSNALMAATYIAFNQGKEAKGKACLRKAFALGREGWFFGNWGTHPDDLARLCSKALEYGIEVEYAREFIRRYRLKPAAGPVQPEHWPWPLKVRALGDFIIYREGEILRFPRKAQKRPLDMLQALVAAGRKGVREEDLADALWPDADGDAALQSLKITLHRLRTLVGREEAVRVREGRVSLDENFCWTDAWTFERQLDEAEGRDAQQAVPLLERAVGLYQGFFLDREMEEPWLLAAGERLRSRFLRGVEKLGSLRSQNGDWGKARECYLKGLEVDGLAEEFCRGAMVCCRHLGLRAEGLSLYRRFEKRLKTELGIEPAVKTKAIRDSLIGEEGRGKREAKDL